MKFRDAVRKLLSNTPEGLTPQELRKLIQYRFPEFYGTISHRNNVEKGHYKDLEHALLAQIYVVQRNASDIYSDRSQKPMKLSLLGSAVPVSDEYEDPADTISTEDFDKLEVGLGTLYILGTHLYTDEGKEIIKIGITSGPVEKRISQLYNTSVPYRFRVIQKLETSNYAELEQSMHKMFDPFRINKSREFFTEDCLEFIDTLFIVHKKIAGVCNT
jgi:hypothetical protein